MINKDIKHKESKFQNKYTVRYSNDEEIERISHSIEELKEEIEQLKNPKKQETQNEDVEDVEDVECDDVKIEFEQEIGECETIEHREWLIKEYEKDIERLKKDNVKLSCYKSKNQVKRLLIKQEQQDILTNWEDAKEYQELKAEYDKINQQIFNIRDKYVEWEYDEYDFKSLSEIHEMDYIDEKQYDILTEEANKIHKKLKIIERQALETAEYMVDGLSTREFNESYYVLSGQKEHDEELKAINDLKQQLEIVELILTDYQNEKLKITMEQMDNFIKMFNKYINEFDDFKEIKPVDVAYNVPLCKVKYLNKIYEVYDFEVDGSCLVDFRKCKDLNGKQKVFQNKYFLEVQATQEDVKPVDKIEIDGVKYDVYKQPVNNSIKKDRIKRKSLITNKMRDLRNVYLIKCD